MAVISIFVFFARRLPPRANFSSKLPKLSFQKLKTKLTKVQKFLMSGKSPTAKNILLENSEPHLSYYTVSNKRGVWNKRRGLQISTFLSKF